MYLIPRSNRLAKMQRPDLPVGDMSEVMRRADKVYGRYTVYTHEASHVDGLTYLKVEDKLIPPTENSRKWTVSYLTTTVVNC